MKYILSSIILAIVLVSCANSKKATDKSQSSKNTTFKNVAEGDSLFAYIRRGACYGSCPIFEIKIYNSGFAELKGTRFVDLIGDYTTTISKEKMLALVEKAKSIGYQNMDDVYDNEMITDIPETNTSIVIDGKRKAIRRRVGFPNEILSFEALFDQLLKTEKWTKIEGSENSEE